MDKNISEFVDALIHNQDKYESLITEYFNTFDIESLGLTYDHFENDIIKLYNVIKDILIKISDLYKEKNGLNETIIKKLDVSSLENIQTFFKKNKYIKFTLKNKNLLNFLNTLVIEGVDKKQLYEFKKYLYKNTNLYQAYFDLFYSNIFYINHKIAFINNLIQKIVKSYNMISNKCIYNFQLYIEGKKSKHNEKSKQLINLSYDTKYNSTDLYNYIINNPDVYFKNNNIIKSNIKLDTPIINNNKDNYIYLPKFQTKNIRENILTKTYGLCNTDLYNLLNNSSLPICYSNKSFYTLYNDIRIQLRGSDYSGLNTINIMGNSIFNIVNHSIKLYSYYYFKGYLLHFNNNQYRFVRNAVINIEFTDKEYEELDNTIKTCNHRYIIIYCSQIQFNLKIKDLIKTHFKGGHKVSLIIDKQKKQITFFDPYGHTEYSIYNNLTNDMSVINVLLALELSKNVSSLDNYTFLYTVISPQEKEHKDEYMDYIYNYNIKQIFSKEKKKLRDWSGGYCGLWNYLYVFLLVINPHMDLSDIYTFFYKITQLEYSSMFVKLLIRNFAYYIENALITPNYIIPLSKLDMKQLESYKIKNIKFESNVSELELSEMTNSNYYEKNILDIPIDDEDFDMEKFVEAHTKLASTFQENFKIAKNIISLASDFSKYIFAKGGLALYHSNKINFIDYR
jgi:hypothetical protein